MRNGHQTNRENCEINITIYVSNNTMNVLQQYNLKSRPILGRPRGGEEAAAAAAAGMNASEGVTIHFSRKLPSDVLKKPKGVSGYATMRREREEEFKPEMPVEGEESGAAAAAPVIKKKKG